MLSPHTVDNYVKLYLQTYNKHVKALRRRALNRKTPVKSRDVGDCAAACSPLGLSLPLASSTSISPEKSMTPQSPMRHNSSSSEESEPSAPPCVSRSRESREFSQLRHRFVPSHLFRPGAQPSTVPNGSAEAVDAGASSVPVAVFLELSHWRLTDEDCSTHFSQIDYMFDDIACNSLWAHDCCGEYSWASPFNVLLYVKAMRVVDVLLVESSWSYIPYAIWAAAILYHLIGPTLISVIDFPVEHVHELERAIIISAPFVQAVYELGLPQMTTLDAKQGDVKVQQRRAAMPYYVRVACERSAAVDSGDESAAASDSTMYLSPEERNLLELLYTAPKIESSFDINESTQKLFERSLAISHQMHTARHVIKEKVYRGLFMHMRQAFQEVFDYKPLYTSTPTIIETTTSDDNKVDFTNRSILTNFFQCDSNNSILSVPITQPFKEHRQLRELSQQQQQQRRRNSQIITSQQNSSSGGRNSASSWSSNSPLVPTGFALPITPQRRRNSAVASEFMSPPLTGFIGSKLPVTAASQPETGGTDLPLMRRKLQLQKTPEHFSVEMPTTQSATNVAVGAACTPPDSGGKILSVSNGALTAAVRDELNDILQQEEAQQNFLMNSRRRSTTNVVNYSSKPGRASRQVKDAGKKSLVMTQAIDSENTEANNMGRKVLISVRSTSSENDVKFVEQRRSLRKAVVLNAASQSAAAAAVDIRKMGPPSASPASKSATAARKRRSVSRSSTCSGGISTTTTGNRRANNNKQMKPDLSQTFLTSAMPPPSATTRSSTVTRSAAAARKAAAAIAASSASQTTQRQTKSNLTLPEMWNMPTTVRNSSAALKK